MHWGKPVIYTHVAAALAAAALAAAGTWQVQNWRYSAKLLKIEAAHTQVLYEADQEALKMQAHLEKERQKVEAQYATAKKRAASDAAAADAALRGLRDALAASAERPRDPASAAIRADGDPREQIIGECAGTLSTVAGHADGLATKLVGLQTYVRQVCLAGSVTP